MEMNTTDLNHVALHVSNLEMSMEFYGKKLGLEEIARPDFDFPGAWYRLGELQELHLIAGRTGAVSSSTRGSHFALGVPDMDEAESFLAERGIDNTSRQIRPDGAFQIYIEDPDGYWIEFCQHPA
jgi:catechol 2,3-dioxygenase-like lactoylglutathione lyase family enzyme